MVKSRAGMAARTPRAKQARPGVPVVPAAPVSPVAGGKFQHRGSGASLPDSVPRVQPAHAAHVGSSRVFPAQRAHRRIGQNPRPVLASSSTPELKSSCVPPKKSWNRGTVEPPPQLTLGLLEGNEANLLINWA